mgnify:CR=1 FL=1|jgi:tRNA 2-thiouridine synthesizing protein B
MSCLHTINRSPKSGLLESCLSVIQKGDAILFIEDGVYHCTDTLAPKLTRQTLDNSVHLYALREDLIARALLLRIPDYITTANYQRFVELSCEHDKVVSWF